MVELLFVWMFFAILFAVFSAAIAVSRGRSGVGWFLIGGIFGAFGLLVAVLPRIERDADSDRRTARHSGRDDDERKCPYYAESVKAEAIKCRFCQSTLVPIEARDEDEDKDEEFEDNPSALGRSIIAVAGVGFLILLIWSNWNGWNG